MEGENMSESFNYENTETKQMGGMKIIRKVSIKRGKGYKSITKYRRGKKISSIKKPIHTQHLKMIKGGRFISGLFNDCKNCNKTRKMR
jgi:hypothetical protein